MADATKTAPATGSTEALDDRTTLLQCPATLVLGTSWVVVFALLTLARSGPFRLSDLLYGGFIDPTISHGFGDVTPWGLYGGQLWRAVTATFVHFNLLHLILNLVAFVQLGRAVESWYGTKLFPLIYVVLGAASNLSANLLRPWISGLEALRVHSGGGSTVVLGLIGLITVVGWRNPTEFSRRARHWLTAILVGNFALGLVVPHIDNLGHAAGAVVGALVGLLDRRLIRLAPTPSATLLGVLGAVALLGSAVAQVDHHRAEAVALQRAGRLGSALEAVVQVQVLYRLLAIHGPSPTQLIPPKAPNLFGLRPLPIPEDPAVLPTLRGALRASVRNLRGRLLESGLPPMDVPLETVHQLAARALTKAPTPEEQAEFQGAIAAIIRPVGASFNAARRDASRLEYPPPLILEAALSRLARPKAPPRPDASAVPTAPEAP